MHLSHLCYKNDVFWLEELILFMFHRVRGVVDLFTVARDGRSGPEPGVPVGVMTFVFASQHQQLHIG